MLWFKNYVFVLPDGGYLGFMGQKGVITSNLCQKRNPSRQGPRQRLDPPDLIMHCKTILLFPLYKVLCRFWLVGAVPQDTRGANIIILYKNKGERSDCNNYRGISLLSIVGKVFARFLYTESQCSFRAERSTVDMIFSLRQLQEKCREQLIPLFIAFIDLTKAFNLVSRDGLFKVLRMSGCPPRLQSMIGSLYTNMKGLVQFNRSSSGPFDIRGGIKQGCVLVFRSAPETCL